MLNIDKFFERIFPAFFVTILVFIGLTFLLIIAGFALQAYVAYQVIKNPEQVGEFAAELIGPVARELKQ